jgi:hypothetical protein
VAELLTRSLFKQLIQSGSTVWSRDRIGVHQNKDPVHSKSHMKILFQICK